MESFEKGFENIELDQTFARSNIFVILDWRPPRIFLALPFFMDASNSS